MPLPRSRTRPIIQCSSGIWRKHPRLSITYTAASVPTTHITAAMSAPYLATTVPGHSAASMPSTDAAPTVPDYSVSSVPTTYLATTVSGHTAASVPTTHT